MVLVINTLDLGKAFNIDSTSSAEALTSPEKRLEPRYQPMCHEKKKLIFREASIDKTYLGSIELII